MTINFVILHRIIFISVEFSSFQWSPDRTKVIYVAEKKGPKTEPFYKQKSAEKLAKEETDGEQISRVLFLIEKFLFHFVILLSNFTE